MSHRLQVLLDEEEIVAIRAAARRRGLSVSEYVRDTLRAAREGEPTVPPTAKLLVVREAAAYAYPVSDPEAMEEEIARGYLESEP